jgi:uncharacterized protein (TIGR03437 family)
LTARLSLVLLLCVGASRLHSQPAISLRGVVNSASFMAPGLPGGAIAQGSIFSIFGVNLGPSSSPALSFPLQTALGGVSIQVFQGATNVAAIPVYVSAGQINAIMPSNAPLGMASVQVTFHNALSNASPIQIVNNSVGLFTANQGGSGPGVLLNYDPKNPQLINSLHSSAKPGQVITLWATGLGPIQGPDNVAPPSGNLPTKVEVFVGGQPATVLYSGRSSCCSGLDQINFPVPATSPLGCWVPVFVRTGDVAVSNAVTMAISTGGSPCSEPSNALAGPLIKGQRTGRALAARIAVHHDVGVATTNDTTTDVSSFYFAQETSGAFNFDPTVSLPPPGTCTAYAYTGDFPLFSGLPPGLPRPTTNGRILDAGVVAIGGASNLALQLDPTGSTTFLGAAIPTISAAQSYLFLDPGSFNFLAAGGADVSSIKAPFNMQPAMTWTNRDQLQAITRTQGFTVNWSAAASGNSIFVSGGGADLPTNSHSVFLCVAKSGDTSLTVPSYVLANIPPARARLIQSRGVLYVGEWSIVNPITFAATGLDFGLVVPIELAGRTVMFQ